MAAVSLHPLASRGGEQSATVVSLQVNACDASTSASTSTSWPADEMRRGSAEMPSSPTTRGGSPTDSRFDAGDEPEWGLRHRDLSCFPSLDGIFDAAEACASSASAPPIRAMSASQLAALHEQYVHADVPHHVVFPFLHGVDGDNTAQNMFFGAPLDGQPTPNYRGLTLVRADMPTRDQAVAMQRRRASSSASGLGMSAARRSRAGSLATTTSSSGHSLASGESHSGNSSDGDSPSPSGAGPARRSPFKHSASSHSVSSSLASSELSSAHSLWNSSETSSAATSVSGSGMAWEGKGSAYPSTSGTSSCASAHEPQPRHSILNSSMLPAELIEPPRSAKLSDGRIVTAPSTFVQPRQAAGVSLRNFRIQSVRYATISDIVLYCPAGLHEGVLALARCFREAQAAMYEERCSRGLGSLRYNVFVVTDPFVAFERSHEHLVAVDSAGTPRNRVDFIEREREEMQRLTAASEIDENVWMGCTADVPMPAAADVDMDPTAAPLDAQSRSAQSNPHAFSICVEAHENGDTPELSRLTYASHWLDSIEATALFELNSKEALRQLEEDEPNVDAADDADLRGFLSLGPNGWSPSSPGRPRKNSRRGQTTPRTDADTPLPSAAAPRSAVVPKPENIIHLECAASSSGFNAMGQEQAIESIVQLCQWIKKQAQPSQMASLVPSAAAAANANSLLASAFRSSGHGPRSQSHGATPLLGSAPAQAPHSPRRVLLHCGDGYTETSILALAYLMYSRDLSLPDAYLDLQLRCKRSFFVYARDMAFLKRVEARMVRERRALRLLQEQREEREAAIAAAAAATADAAAPRSALSKPSFSWGVGGSSDEAGKRIGGLASRRSTSSRRGSSSSADVSGHALTEPSVWQRGLAAASVLVGAAQGHQGGRKSAAMANDARTRTPTPRGARSPVISPTKPAAAAAAPTSDRRWFSDARFEGSFPSRILPFLYLGNLNHALNPAMLHALGITHVVSVGETALTPPASEFSMATDGDAAPTALPAPPALHNSLWHEERAGRISVLDLKNVSDDGIDPLRSTMREAVEYIEAARRSGGSVLVHCRVGVSRSSTIVLAYVMGHLDLNLVEAYLLVRSRRLNILIQPHLLFFWELRGWETYLAAQKAKRAHGGGHRRSENEEMADGTGASLLDSFSRLTPSDDAAMEVSTLSRLSDRVSRPALPWRRATSAGDGRERGRSRSLGRRSGLCGDDSMADAAGCGEEQQAADLDMDLGLGAGSLHRAEPLAQELVAALPFGCGSPSSLSAASMRLTWGFLCREITALNERYFI